MLVCLGELKILFNDNFHQGVYVALVSGELQVIQIHVHTFFC